MGEYITPRVNKELIPNFVGRNVRLIGKVNQAPNGGKAILQASDNGLVTVNTQPGSEGTWTDQYMEVIGKVNPDHSMSELFSTNFGNNFGNIHFIFLIQSKL